MPEKSTCILVYSRHQQVLETLEMLQAHAFSMAAVSIICNEADEQPGRRHPQNDYLAIWQDFCRVLDDEPFIFYHNLERVVAMGAIVRLLVAEHDELDVGNQPAELVAALFDLGITQANIRGYEDALKNGKTLLIINSTCDEVDYVSQLLHNEKQQVTVHLA